MDEIDILDPGDNYLFVMKQCNYFCYDKLKILLDSKYGFRKIVPDTNNNIGKEMMLKLKYLGSLNIHTNNGKIHSIKPIYEHEFYTNDNEINEIYIKRYKSKMINYYVDLIKKIYVYTHDIIIDRVNWQIIFTEQWRPSSSIESLNDKYFYKVINSIIIHERQLKIIEVYEKI